VSRIGEALIPRRLGTGFRWLLASSWTSNVGDGIALAAGPLLVASQTTSAFLVALAAMLERLPWLMFGLWAGAIADRLDRRVIVMVSDGLRAVVVAVLVGTIVTGHISIVVVLATMFTYGIAEVFADTTTSALAPMLVKITDLGLANARLQAGFLIANQLAGPPIGAFLFAVGMAWPFAVQVVCVALSVVLVSRIATPKGGVRESVHTHVREDIAEGLRWIWHHPPVRTLMLVILVFNVTWAAPWGVLVLYATKHLGMTAVGFGLLTTASAIGGLISTGWFGWLERHVPYATLMRICLSLEVLMHLSMALTTTGWVAIVIMVVFGAYAFVWGTISVTVRQRAVPTELQGRIAAVNSVCVFGGLVIGQALGGLIAQRWGLTAPWWFAFVGAGITLALVWRQLDSVARADVPAASARTNPPAIK
jgi:MFS family permease